MQNFYEATITRTPYPQLNTRIETSICIIGGGLAGLSTALSLVERGVRDVVVLEAQTLGFGASGRNGGFVFGGYSLDNAALLRQLGSVEARRLYRLTLDAIDLIRERIARYAIDCDLVDAGVILADWLGYPTRLHASCKLMKEAFGVDWEPLSASELRTHLHTTRYGGGLFERDAFHFHPLKYVLGIATAIHQSGARIFEHSAACSIRRQGASFIITTRHGVVQAQEVVFAGGGYVHGTHPRIERSVLPIATYIITTEPLNTRLAETLSSAAAIYDTRYAFDYYRPLNDTRILWGGRISIFNRNPTAIARLLKKDMTTVYPQLHNVAVQYAWSGLMSYARHKMPQIGRAPDNVWHAIGFGGHGIAPTAVAGEILAAAIAEQRITPEGFAAYGLSPTFGIAGLVAAQLTYTALQARDAFITRQHPIS